MVPFLSPAWIHLHSSISRTLFGCFVQFYLPLTLEGFKHLSLHCGINIRAAGRPLHLSVQSVFLAYRSHIILWMDNFCALHRMGGHAAILHILHSARFVLTFSCPMLFLLFAGCEYLPVAIRFCLTCLLIPRFFFYTGGSFGLIILIISSWSFFLL